MSNISFQPGEKLQIRLVRAGPSNPWGFRLQGGIDFSTPLSIQSVNPGSVSEQCGLKPGDAILAINNQNSDSMTHDDAKAEIIQSGNEIIMLVERGAVKIWKPQVTPLSDLRPQELNTIKSATGEEIAPVQKTSLVFNKPVDEPCRIGSSHNRSARPFGAPKVAVPNVVHAQYNSPMGLYSANNIADSYSQQTEGIQQQMTGLDIAEDQVGTVLSGSGQVLQQDVTPDGQGNAPGPENVTSTSPASETSAPDLTPPVPVQELESSESETKDLETKELESNEPETAPPSVQQMPAPASTVYYKNPTPFGSTPSGPTRAYQSVSTPTQSAVYEEQSGDTPNYKGYTNPNLQSRTFNILQEQLAQEEENNNTGNVSGIRSVSAPVAKPPSEKPQQPSMRCGGCDMLATGVIVKANGVPYHVACFKCTSCSMNLKQKGFFVVDGKLYCETHAKRNAQPPGPDMVATAVYR